MLSAVFKEVGLTVLVRMDTAAMANHAKILTNAKKDHILATLMLLARTREEAFSVLALMGTSGTAKSALKCVPKTVYRRI